MVIHPVVWPLYGTLHCTELQHFMTVWFCHRESRLLHPWPCHPRVSHHRIRPRHISIKSTLLPGSTVNLFYCMCYDQLRVSQTWVSRCNLVSSVMYGIIFDYITKNITPSVVTIYLILQRLDM